MTEGCKYDFFISYAEDARGWVNGELLPKLLRAAKRCLREEDLGSEEPWLEAVQEAIMKSCKVLLILTPQYLASREKAFIKVMGFTKGVEQRDWPVIPILIKPIDRELLLRSIGVIDLTNADQEEALARLLQHEGVEDARAEKEIIMPPYPGMAPFREEDERIFFGREDEIIRYVDYLHENRLLVLVGASGCGKSSLAAAGVIPKLRRSQHLFGNAKWLVKRFRPSEQPFVALIRQYGDQTFTEPERLVNALLHEQGDVNHLLLFVDQFEEVFALDQHGIDEPKQQRLGNQAQTFLQNLAALAQQKNVFILITVRDEFYHQLAWCQEWLDLDKHLQRVGFLGRKGLADAIRKPAERVGVWLVDVLVERLVNDAGDDPGILPFVQETMRKLWGMMNERYLRVEDYEKLGGEGEVSGLKYAIAVKADSAFKSLPSEAHRNIARRIFIRLVQFGEGKPDTRRQQPLSALRANHDLSGVFDETVAHLSSEQYRLLTLSGEKSAEPRIDIVHESLIRAWPQLQDWIEKYKYDEEKRRDLDNRAVKWVESGRKLKGLLDIYELKDVDAWIANLKEVSVMLNEDVGDFMIKSRMESNPGWSGKGIAVILILLLSFVVFLLSIYQHLLWLKSFFYLFIYIFVILFVIVVFVGGGGRYYRMQRASQSWSNGGRRIFAVLFFIASVVVFYYDSIDFLIDRHFCEKEGVNTDAEVFNEVRSILISSGDISISDLIILKNVLAGLSGWSSIFIDNNNMQRCEQFFTEKIILYNNNGVYSAIINDLTGNNEKYSEGIKSTIFASENLSGCAALMDIGSKILSAKGEFYYEKVYPASCEAVASYMDCKKEFDKDKPNLSLASQKCQEATRKSGDFFNAHALLSEIYLKEGDIEKALDVMLLVNSKVTIQSMPKPI